MPFKAKRFDLVIKKIHKFLPARDGQVLSDPRLEGTGDACPPPPSNFFHFHAVFDKNFAK